MKINFRTLFLIFLQVDIFSEIMSNLGEGALKHNLQHLTPQLMGIHDIQKIMDLNINDLKKDGRQFAFNVEDAYDK